MKIRALLASAAVVLLLTGEAFAFKAQTQVTPKSQDAVGFSVVSEPRDGGMLRVTITRDLAKARKFEPGSDLEVRRGATLRVYGDAGLLVECPVDADKEKNTLVYRFAIARDRVANSHFTLAEIDDYKDTENREHLLGGGTYFEFSLADFIA